MPGNRRRQDDNPGNLERWLLTYADMITLLLLFFIVMFAISTVEAKKFEQVVESLGTVFGGGRPGLVTEETQAIINVSPVNQAYTGKYPLSNKRAHQQALSFEKTISALRPIVSSRKVRVQLDERGLVITLASDAYFDPGSAELRNDAKEVLEKIYPVLREISNKIRVEGNADDIQINPELVVNGAVKYNSNWELSSQRAINVLKFLVSGGVDPKRIFSVAYGDTRPIESNNNPESRAFNRRVDIVVVTEAGE
jgi:chemotaxis protein MotB